MDEQASREMATVEVFGQCVLQAPTIEAKIRMTRFQHEELKHYQLLARLDLARPLRRDVKGSRGRIQA